MNDRAVPNLPARGFSAITDFYARFSSVEAFRDDRWLDLDGIWSAISGSGVTVAEAGIPRTRRACSVGPCLLLISE